MRSTRETVETIPHDHRMRKPVAIQLRNNFLYPKELVDFRAPQLCKSFAGIEEMSVADASQEQGKQIRSDRELTFGNNADLGISALQ